MYNSNYPLIAFDTDGTLVDENGYREDIIQLLQDHLDKGHNVIVWSGQGQAHAKEVGDAIGLDGVSYQAKDGVTMPDIAYDNDEWFTGAKKIIKV